MNAGRVEGAAVPFARVVAKPLEHPFVSPVGAGHKAVEGHHHLENYFSIGHIGRDVPACMNSSARTIPVVTAELDKRQVREERGAVEERREEHEQDHSGVQPHLRHARNEANSAPPMTSTIGYGTASRW